MPPGSHASDHEKLTFGPAAVAPFDGETSVGAAGGAVTVNVRVAAYAEQLAFFQVRYGDWREMFRNVERIDKVTKEDVMRVAKATFVPTNRTVGMIENADAVQAAK